LLFILLPSPYKPILDLLPARARQVRTALGEPGLGLAYAPILLLLGLLLPPPLLDVFVFGQTVESLGDVPSVWEGS